MVQAGDASGDGELDLAEFVDFMLTEPWRSELRLRGQMEVPSVCERVRL